MQSTFDSKMSGHRHIVSELNDSCLHALRYDNLWLTALCSLPIHNSISHTQTILTAHIELSDVIQSVVTSVTVLQTSDDG